MSKFIDLTGQKLGRLLVLERAENNKRGYACWHCRCDCGKECIVKGANLIGGHTRSCGCLWREVHTTHGMHGSPEYIVWKGMIQRCQKPNRQNYVKYGGRGITVCERWHKFENFFADMGRRPEGMTLDRIDSNGNYEPANCRWATISEQNNNTRSNRHVMLDGKRLTIAECARRIGVGRTTVSNWLKSGKLEAAD